MSFSGRRTWHRWPFQLANCICRLIRISQLYMWFLVRQAKGLPTASFRSHLTMGTHAVQLCTSSLPTRTRDFHPLERAHGEHTKGRHERISHSCLFFFILRATNPFHHILVCYHLLKSAICFNQALLTRYLLCLDQRMAGFVP